MRKKRQEDILAGSSECHTVCLRFLMCGRASHLQVLWQHDARQPKMAKEQLLFGSSIAVHQLGNSPPTPNSTHQQSHNITPKNVTAVLCPSVYHFSEVAWPLRGHINSCDMCWGPMAADHEQHAQVSLPSRLRAFKSSEVCSVSTGRTQSLPVTV